MGLGRHDNVGREQGLHFGVMPCDHVCAGYADENDAKNENRLKGSFEISGSDGAACCVGERQPS